MSERKNAKKTRRMTLLEAARQGSYNLSIPIERIHPLRSEQTGWDFFIRNDDSNLRLLLKGFFYVEKLKLELETVPKEDWYVFGKLDINELRLIATDMRFQARHTQPTTLIGKYFLKALNIFNEVKGKFPDYNLHPYAKFFTEGDCKEIYLAYHNDLAFKFSLTESTRMSEAGVDLVKPLLIHAQKTAEIIDRELPRLMDEMLSVSQNAKIRTFEQKSDRNDRAFRDFIETATRDQERVNFIVKLTLNFISLRYDLNLSLPRDTQDVIQSSVNAKYAECFSEALTKFNDKVTAAKQHEGFVTGLHVIKSSMNEGLHSHGYFVMSYLRDKIFFDSESLELWQHFDKEVFKRLKRYAGIRSSNELNRIANCLNDTMATDVSLKKLSSYLEKENPVVKSEGTNKKNGKKEKVNNPWIMTDKKFALLTEFISNHQKIRVLSSLMWLKSAWVHIACDALKDVDWTAIDISNVRTNCASVDVRLNHILKSDAYSVTAFIAPPDLLKKREFKKVSVNKKHHYKRNFSTRWYCKGWHKKKWHNQKTHYGMFHYQSYLKSLLAESLSDKLNAEMQIGIPESSNIIHHLDKASMASMLFMTLNFKGKILKEIREFAKPTDLVMSLIIH